MGKDEERAGKVRGRKQERYINVRKDDGEGKIRWREEERKDGEEEGDCEDDVERR